MPIKARVDRRYCKGACRTLAYRVRHRIKATRPPGPLEPEWAEPNAVVKTMLTSLAQIQARVLDFAHQLEEEELYSRLPIRTQNRESEIAKSKQGVSDSAGSQIPVFDERGKEFRQSSTGHAESTLRIDGVDFTARLDEVKKHRDMLQAELLSERERTGILEAQIKNLHKEANEVLGRWKSQNDHLQRTNDGLTARVQNLEAQLQRMNEILATWEKAVAESMSIVARSNTLQRENAALRTEVNRWRPPPSDTDPLVLLMRDRVKALHWLAVYESRTGAKATGQFLPAYDNAQILHAAEQQAFAARRDFYFRTLWPNEAKPRWLTEDRLLDPDSEKKVYDDAKDKNQQVLSRLESARRRAGANP